MFSSITSYLWGSGEADQQVEDADAQPAAGSDQVQPLSADKPAAAGVSGQLKTRLTDNEADDDDDDWLLVDPASSRDASPHHTVRERYRGSNDSPPNICYDYFEHNSSDSCPSDGGAPFWASAAAGTRPMGFPSDRFSPNTSGASTPVHIVYPSMEESWLVTPPPCFTAGGNSPHRMETSPLENLLIEHPSMSVYTSRGRPHSTGVESSDSENEDVDEAQPERVVASVRQPPHQGRAVAARVGLAAQGAMARSMQVSKQRQEARQVCRSKLQRSNQALHQASANRHPRRKHYMLRSSGRSNNRHNYTC